MAEQSDNEPQIANGTKVHVKGTLTGNSLEPDTLIKFSHPRGG